MYAIPRVTLLLLLLSSCGGPPTPPAGVVEVPASPAWSPQRVAHIARLEKDGFIVARSLPEGRNSVPRPTREVAARLMALKTLFLRTVIPEDALPEATLQAYMERNGLVTSLTPSERKIWETPRA